MASSGCQQVIEIERSSDHCQAAIGSHIIARAMDVERKKRYARELAAAAKRRLSARFERSYGMFERSFRLLGRQGLLGMALSGIDMALWDALGRALDQPVVALLPILVMWLGIGETMKIAFLFIGQGPRFEEIRGAAAAR